MAGRTSTTVAAGKASSIFENTSSLPVVLAINAISADNTKNPQCSIVIDTNNARPLNFIEVKKTLAQEVTFATGGFDLQSTSAGTTIIHPSVAANKQRMAVNGTSYSNNAAMKYAYFDSYFLENPAAYGKGTAYNYFMIASNDAYLKADLQKDRSFFPAWLQGGSASSGDTVTTTSLSYYNARSMHDVWTDMVIGINTGAHMTQRLAHTYVPSTGNVGGNPGGNRSSDSFYYNYSGGGYNPVSYEYNDGLKLDLQSDGGVFVLGMHPSRSDGDMHRMGMLSSRMFRDNGNAQPVGTRIKNAEDVNTSQGSTSFVNAGELWHARYNMTASTGMVASWFKYHPTEDKYYMNIQGSTAAVNGVWSAFHDTIFGSGSWNERNFEDIWTKETGLTHDLTAYTSQPERIGASLWVCFKGANQSQALYSTDLKNWKTAAEHSGISNAVLLAFDTSNNDTYFLKSTEQTKLFGTNSGFSTIPQQGLIENGVGVGTFERNGLVLNAGDCLYLENKDTTTSIHATVTFLEV